MKRTILACAIVLGSLTQTGFAADAAKGKALYKEYDCAICHSRDGMGEAKVVNGVPSMAPDAGSRVAGLPEDYSVAQMLAIQGLDEKTERKTEFTKSMKKQIKGLSKTDMEDLAAYLAKEINPEAGAYKSTLAK